LLKALPDLLWLRLMYAYPNHVTDRLIEVMASHPQVCHYLDLPLQHAHPDVLRRMRRPADIDRVRELIAHLRSAMPDIALRTTFIVGYPDETEEEFQALEEFVKEMRFDRVGVFTYSQEEGTPAAELPGQLPLAVKRKRRDRLMATQRQISLELNRQQVGRRLQVLIEGVVEEHSSKRRQGRDGSAQPLLVGRSYRDAPEVDGLVLCQGLGRPGDLVEVEVTGAMEYDLLGIVTRDLAFERVVES